MQSIAMIVRHYFSSLQNHYKLIVGLIILAVPLAELTRHGLLVGTAFLIKQLNVGGGAGSGIGGILVAARALGVVHAPGVVVSTGLFKVAEGIVAYRCLRNIKSPRSHWRRLIVPALTQGAVLDSAGAHAEKMPPDRRPLARRTIQYRVQASNHDEDTALHFDVPDFGFWPRF